MGPIDLYLVPAELDYRREQVGTPRYRRPRRRRTVARRAAQPTGGRLP